MGRGNYKKKQARITTQEVKKMDEFFEEVLPLEAAAPQVEEQVVEEAQPTSLFKVRVTHPLVRHRTEPNLKAAVIGLITNKGIYDIFEIQDGWGKLEDGSWIMLEFTEKIPE